jgi:lysophospholipase
MNDTFLSQQELENSQKYIQEGKKRYQEIILPFYQEKGKTIEFLGAKNIKISCRIFEIENPRGKIILATGYNESYLKYSEFIMDLCQLGFSVYCYDHRGQGFSERFPNQKKRGYVDQFFNYVNDLKTFFNSVKNMSKSSLPLFIIAHSMGGAICATAVGDKIILPDGVVLCAPMLEIALSPYSILEYPIFLLAALFCKLNMGKKYVFGQKDCQPFSPFEGNDVTHCQLRYDIWRHHIAETDALQLGGPTFQWLKESIAASRRARKHIGKANTVPLLLLQADQDTVVKNKGQDLFIKNFSHSSKITLNNCQHEILMELTVTRQKAIEFIQNFLTSLLTK